MTSYADYYYSKVRFMALLSIMIHDWLKEVNDLTKPEEKVRNLIRFKTFKELGEYVEYVAPRVQLEKL